MKGARQIAKALQVNHVLTELDLEIQLGERDFYSRHQGLRTEIYRFLAVNRALDSKLLALMMSMHARLGAGSGLRILDDHLVTMICDVYCREQKASSLLDEGDVEDDSEEGAFSIPSFRPPFMGDSDVEDDSENARDWHGVRYWDSEDSD